MTAPERSESPFPADPDRHEIWTMLVERDIAAYVAGDWSLVEDDFVDHAEFVAVDARARSNPDSWRLGRALDGYRDAWLTGSARLRAQTAPGELEAALENCRRQLGTAGCDLADVVKVNVYLSDMAMWERFNAVYRELVPEPYPVRTAVGAALLDGLLVEVEMWAARR